MPLPAVRIDSFELLQGELQLRVTVAQQPFATELKPITFTLGISAPSPTTTTLLTLPHSPKPRSLRLARRFHMQPLSAMGAGRSPGSKPNHSVVSARGLPFRLLSGAVKLTG